jgi:hypothetical protein
MLGEGIVLNAHDDAPALLFCGDMDTRRILKSRRQHRSHFEHRCYRGLTTVAVDWSLTGSGCIGAGVFDFLD